jgi:glycine cleavage system H protein
MTTGYSTVGNALRSLQCGAVDYLTKPFTADELMAVVQRALEHASVCTSLPSAQPTGGPCAENFYRLGLVSWVRTEPSGTALIGVHETFARTLKGIRKLQLLPEGTLLVQGTYCATIISSEGREHGVLCPLSGQVLEAQAAVSSNPALLENDPGGAGWLYRVIPTNLENGLRNLSSPLGTCKPHEVSRIGETL